MRFLLAGLTALAVTLLVACEDTPTGPCVHHYREALLNIVAAQDERDGTSLTSVVLKHVRRNEVEQEWHFLVGDRTTYGVDVQGDSLVCRVPCGFGTQQGNYIFTVSAAGYPPQERGYEAAYRVFKGGCPSYNDGGVRITLKLRH